MIRKLKKIFSKVGASVLAAVMLAGSIPINAASSIPEAILAPFAIDCVVSANTSMIRSVYYRAGAQWADVNQSNVNSCSTINGETYWEFTYRQGSNSVSVNSTGYSGISLGEVKRLLNEHPEGVVLWASNGSRMHAVFLTDYEGDTIYCAENASRSNIPACKRIPLASSLLGSYFGNQGSILANTKRVWYVTGSSFVSSSSIPDVSNKPYIYQGDYGDSVREMQTKLIACGFSCGPEGADGGFGVNTLNAVLAFQKHYSLAVDGVCGPETWSKLEEVYAASLNHDPDGACDLVEVVNSRQLRISGWAIDVDEPLKSIDVHVYVGGPAGSGAKCYVIKTDQNRPDINNYFKATGDHGYSAVLDISATGSVPVYVYAINSVRGNNPEIGGKTVDVIPVTSVSISKSSLELNNNSSETLTAVPNPGNASDKGVTWNSSNTAVATVDANGRVTAKAIGSAVITATIGGKPAGCNVTVTCAHTVVKDAAVAATCTTDGLTEGSHCSTCGEVLTHQTVVPATGHTEVIDAAVEATTTSTGLTEGSHCSACGEILVHQTETPAIEVPEEPEVPEIPEVPEDPAPSTGSGQNSGGTSNTVDTVDTVEISETDPQILVESVEGKPGRQVQVKVSLKNNPGVASLKLSVDYGENLKLTSVEYNPELGGVKMDPNKLESNFLLNWFNAIEDVEGDVTYATLTFDVDPEAEAGTTEKVTVSYSQPDLYNLREEDVSFKVVQGGVTIRTHTPGDVNGDGNVNNRDVTRLFQYLSGYDVEVDDAALDINGDGMVSNKDLTRLFQKVSGYNVPIY